MNVLQASFSFCSLVTIQAGSYEHLAGHDFILPSVSFTWFSFTVGHWCEHGGHRRALGKSEKTDAGENVGSGFQKGSKACEVLSSEHLRLRNSSCGTHTCLTAKWLFEVKFAVPEELRWNMALKR